MNGENNFVLDQMIWSFSRIKSYENCKHEWYLNYIECVSEDKCSNVFAEFGTFCHLILQKYLNYELEKNELAEFYQEYFEDYVKTICFMKNDIQGNLYEAGLKYFQNINLDPKKLNIISVEQEYLDTIGNYKFRGIIDLLYKDGDDYVIMDHKSARSPLTKSNTVKKSCLEKVEEYKKQLYLYSMFVKNKLNKFPKYLEWNFFRDNKIYRIEFDINEYHKSLDWAKTTIDRIYQEDRFEPNQDFFYCSHLCDFRTICDYN